MILVNHNVSNLIHRKYIKTLSILLIINYKKYIHYHHMHQDFL